MAIDGPLPVAFGDVFPRGAFATSVEKLRDFDKSTRDNFVQATTAEGVPWWSLILIDGDTNARQQSVKVKIASHEEPVLPEPVPGSPFAPVELEGLRVRPYVERESKRLAYSFTATGVRSPRQDTTRATSNGATVSASSSASGSSGKESSGQSAKDTA